MPSQTSQWSIVLSHTNGFVIGTKMKTPILQKATGNIFNMFNLKIVCLVVCDLKTLQLSALVMEWGNPKLVPKNYSRFCC